MIRHIFEGIPKFLRIICLITILIFSLIGLSLFLRLIGTSPPHALLMLIFYLLLGCGCDLAFVYGWRALIKFSKRSLHTRLNTLFEQQGYTADFAQTIVSALPFPTVKETLFGIYACVMAEDYEKASQQLLRLQTDDLTGRELAVSQTCRMMIWAMNRQTEKALNLYETQHRAMDSAYQMKPDLFDQYYPYADDALTYYLLAGTLAELEGDSAAVSQYRSSIQFQLSNQTNSAAAKYIPQIFELNRLFISGKTEEAHTAENALRGSVETSGIPSGIKQNLLRLISQARVYYSFAELGSRVGAHITERRMPKF